MPLIADTARRLAGEERGFTLMEALMAMLCGIVVTGALFAILEVSLRQTSRLTDKVQATQLGRVAMTKLTDELRSACLSRNFTPVQEKSTATKLIFETAYSEKAVIESSEASLHEVEWVEKPGPTKIVDKIEQSTGGQWPKFTYGGAVQKSVLLAENVYAPESNGAFFKYYKYASTASEGTAVAGSSALTEITGISASGLTEVQANETAAVLVSFATAPSNNSTSLGRPIELSNLTTFAFASPASEATIVDGPCQ